MPASSTSYQVDDVLKRLLAEGYTGEILSVEIQRVGRAFADHNGPLDWRHNHEFSGLNILNAGGTYESMMRWLGRGTRVMAMAKVHVPFRRGAGGARMSVALPDHVDVVYELANGAQVHMGSARRRACRRATRPGSTAPWAPSSSTRSAASNR